MAMDRAAVASCCSAGFAAVIQPGRRGCGRVDQGVASALSSAALGGFHLKAHGVASGYYFVICKHVLCVLTKRSRDGRSAPEEVTGTLLEPCCRCRNQSRLFPDNTRGDHRPSYGSVSQPTDDAGARITDPHPADGTCERGLKADRVDFVIAVEEDNQAPVEKIEL